MGPFFLLLLRLCLGERGGGGSGTARGAVAAPMPMGWSTAVLRLRSKAPRVAWRNPGKSGINAGAATRDLS